MAEEAEGKALEKEEERFKLVRSVGEECVQEDELRELLRRKREVVCYDGFEPSGRMHIAQGVQKALNVNRLTRAGCTFKFLVADWFAMMNKKMGGDLHKIQTVGDYLVEVRCSCPESCTMVRCNQLHLPRAHCRSGRHLAWT